MSIFTPDPENLNQDEEAELTARLVQAVHEYEPGPDGTCIAEERRYCKIHHVNDWCNLCGLPSYSVLHYEDNPTSEGNAHWHGGGDCMCNEGDY